jgi:DNA-directed RNA polymerase specialized sigma24 family protein
MYHRLPVSSISEAVSKLTALKCRMVKSTSRASPERALRGGAPAFLLAPLFSSRTSRPSWLSSAHFGTAQRCRPASVNHDGREVRMQHSLAHTQSEPKNVRELADSLYRQRRSHLLSIAHANTACKADAEGAVQDALLAFVLHFDPDGDSPPLPWLILTLKRECWRRARRGRYELRRTDNDPEARYEETGAVLEAVPGRGQPVDEQLIRREEARRRLRLLRLDERIAVGLQACGYSYEEIAEHCGWTYTKVSRCLREGREALAA